MHTTPAPEEKRKKIEAEKQFDKATYGGMGGIITVLLSIAAGDWVINGSGKEKCLYAAQRAGSAVSRITGAAPAKCVNVIHNAFVTTGLMMGGLITLYPIKKNGGQ